MEQGRAKLRLVEAPREEGDALSGRRAPPLPQTDDQEAPPLSGAFRQYAPYVAAIALRLLGRDDEVDDVVQDVFLDAIRGAAKLRRREALKAWLATVTVRVARRRLRTRRLRGWLGFDKAYDYEQTVAPGASPEDRAFLARVYRVLDALPIEQRLAWALRYVNGDDLEGVAAACGCSLATVKRRIAAAQAAVEGAVRDA
jgi:RNA polymerase sigma-70 factor, ECF subfamily